MKIPISLCLVPLFFAGCKAPPTTPSYPPEPTTSYGEIQPLDSSTDREARSRSAAQYAAEREERYSELVSFFGSSGVTKELKASADRGILQQGMGRALVAWAWREPNSRDVVNNGIIEHWHWHTRYARFENGRLAVWSEDR